LHVAHFTNAYLPVVSGVVRAVSILRKTLAELGHNVFIFAPEDDYQDDQPFIFRYRSLSLPQPVDAPAAIPVSPFIDRLIPILKLDVIHSHHPILLGQVAANKAEEQNLPLVFTFHTQYREYTRYFPVSQEALQKRLKETVENWLRDYMRRCQHIVVPSRSMGDILVGEYGLQSHYTIIPTGIDLSPFQNFDGKSLRARMGWGTDHIMVSVGRLAPEKNWPTLLQAAGLVMQRYPDFRAVIIGDGPERQALQDFCSQAGIADKVEFTGKVPFSKIPQYLCAADFFGFASTAETQGLVTLEALAAGLPVIAVEASGTRDILQHDRQGFLVPDEPDAFAGAVCQLIENEALAARFQAAALERAQAFDAKRLTKKLLDVYEQAIEDKQDNRFVEIDTPG
jgi:glycosyltransferase involved in cell wall biosynthesis